jgi:hypothetical protein
MDVDVDADASCRGSCVLVAKKMELLRARSSYVAKI